MSSINNVFTLEQMVMLTSGVGKSFKVLMKLQQLAVSLMCKIQFTNGRAMMCFVLNEKSVTDNYGNLLFGSESSNLKITNKLTLIKSGATTYFVQIDENGKKLCKVYFGNFATLTDTYSDLSKKLSVIEAKEIHEFENCIFQFVLRKEPECSNLISYPQIVTNMNYFDAIMSACSNPDFNFDFVILLQDGRVFRLTLIQDCLRVAGSHIEMYTNRSTVSGPLNTANLTEFLIINKDGIRYFKNTKILVNSETKKSVPVIRDNYSSNYFIQYTDEIKCNYQILSGTISNIERDKTSKIEVAVKAILIERHK